MPLPNDNLFFDFAQTMTEEQRSYVDSIIDNKVTVTNSKAGTGKTTLAVATAKFLQRDLVYVFSPTQEDEMGFRPGTMWDKMQEYLTPLFDALEEIGEDPYKCVVNEDALTDPKLRSQAMKNLKAGKAWVTVKPHTFLRGSNLKGNKMVIIDEAQNFTKKQLKKILTRCHDDVIVVLIGHTGQTDIVDKSGFEEYLEFYKTRPYAKVVNLTKNFRGVIATEADAV